MYLNDGLGNSRSLHVKFLAHQEELAPLRLNVVVSKSHSIFEADLVTTSTDHNSHDGGDLGPIIANIKKPDPNWDSNASNNT